MAGMVPGEENTALEILDIIKRYDDLTVPEFFARIAENPTTLFRKLEHLTAVGLVKIDPGALDELKSFVINIDRRMANASLRDRRAELLKQASRSTARTRSATLTSASP